MSDGILTAVVVRSTTCDVTGVAVTSSVELLRGLVTAAHMMIRDKIDARGLYDMQSVSHQNNIFLSENDNF